MKFDMLPISTDTTNSNRFPLYLHITNSKEFIKFLYQYLELINRNIEQIQQSIISSKREAFIKQKRTELKFNRQEQQDCQRLYKKAKSFLKLLDNPELISYYRIFKISLVIK